MDLGITFQAKLEVRKWEESKSKPRRDKSQGLVQ